MTDRLIARLRTVEQHHDKVASYGGAAQEHHTRMQTTAVDAILALTEREQQLDAMTAIAQRRQDVLDALRSRLATIIDEAWGTQPVMTLDELLDFLEERVRKDRAERERLATINAGYAEATRQLQVDITTLRNEHARRNPPIASPAEIEAFLTKTTGKDR